MFFELLIYTFLIIIFAVDKKIIKKEEKTMATPIRFAPVLYGKDAENFYKIWADSWKEPAKVPPKEERERIRKFIKDNNM